MLFVRGVTSVISGFVSPALALALGISFGMLVHPFQKVNHVWEVAAGEVLRAGRSGFVYTALAIAMSLGLVLGKVLKVQSKVAFLTTVGTTICAGSAIAAVAAVDDTSTDELAMSLGTVFTLKAVALLVFPAIGLALHLTQTQFGLWAALAIHDTSSVVGAAANSGRGP